MREARPTRALMSPMYADIPSTTSTMRMGKPPEAIVSVGAAAPRV